MGRSAWAPVVELGPPALWPGSRRRRTAWHAQHCPARPRWAQGSTQGPSGPLLPPSLPFRSLPVCFGERFPCREVSEPRTWSPHTVVVALPTGASVACGVRGLHSEPAASRPKHSPVVPRWPPAKGLFPECSFLGVDICPRPRWSAARRGVRAQGETYFNDLSGPGLTIASASGRWSVLCDLFWRAGAVPVIEF